MEYPPPLLALANSQPYLLLFATVSGAHLYGFPSPDSDFDLRGVHVLPLTNIVGLDKGPETIEKSTIVDGLELDLVTHDIGMFCELLLRKNGLVLENIVSPLVVRTSPAHQELRALVPRLVTRHHAYHYLGLAASRWKAFAEGEQHKVKPLLYAFRGLLTGLYLLETGEVEASLVRLNEHFRLPYLAELIAQKVGGEERGVLRDGDMALIEREYLRLRAELERQHAASALPEHSDARSALHDLLVRLRLAAR